MRLQVRTPKQTDWLGSVHFTVSIFVGDNIVRKIIVPAYIEIWDDVLLTAKPLGRGQPITPDCIKTVRMNLAKAPKNAILSKERVMGRRAKRSIGANRILCRNQVEVLPVVKRGDLVQVVARSTALNISTKGMARESGGPGERIRVQNMSSKRIIYAQILDAQTVQVDF
jgi:flagella basal body P-ring formation protein FlgA